ncbi:phosphogluconate dehydratase [Microvirga sp. VF16]|uniref:phosphogluconate dehydratase n=1 Tax=Microvirga sp. VF16 TaxID=2807101 RepID=UPI00193DF5CD|nr:phosphogluconate dehydratase [Microvirga sp. VF16]QRM34048.1 phosphogluconate dehydratase [Microvirga sp. VF16]
MMSFAPTGQVLEDVAARIAARSGELRREYLARLEEVRRSHPPRRKLSCGNLAHAAAACSAHEKMPVATGSVPNLGIVTSYNDMLSAHQPFATYPDLIKEEARTRGATAQVAGGVPAMCDGVTQGQPGMELSLFSRDVIAMSTAISLSHNVFDAALMLGVCDKIVPGLVMGALSCGHLPTVFVPAGPMPTGLSNDEKTRVRQAYASGEVGRDALLASEMKSYHAPGTCTFYGTANSNQMMMEIMGLHVPGAAFVPPGTPLRDALTRAAVRLSVDAVRAPQGVRGIGERLGPKAFVNAIVGLHATGGSTNHLLHLVAMARAAGLVITWEDFSDLATVVPLLARIYPNGPADVNQFHGAGSIAFVIRALLRGGLLFREIETVAGHDLAAYAREPWLDSGRLAYRDVADEPLEPSILRTIDNPFQANGGLALLTGNLGRAVVKTSAVRSDRLALTAPARVFESQEQFMEAFKANQFDRDVVIVVRQQGPKANGMPELHSLMPALGVLENRGLRVSLLTDGRLSGASGKILSALHVTPEAESGGPIGLIQDGDLITIDAATGRLELAVDAARLMARVPARSNSAAATASLGRDLFSVFRASVGRADLGAATFWSEVA